MMLADVVRFVPKVNMRNAVEIMAFTVIVVLVYIVIILMVMKKDLVIVEVSKTYYDFVYV